MVLGVAASVVENDRELHGLVNGIVDVCYFLLLCCWGMVVFLKADLNQKAGTLKNTFITFSYIYVFSLFCLCSCMQISSSAVFFFFPLSYISMPKKLEIILHLISVFRCYKICSMHC